MIVVFALLFCSLLTGASDCLFYASNASEREESLALVGAKIYPSPTEKPILNGVVLVRGGKITAVGERGKIKVPGQAKVIDCTGLTLCAGFWNSHVHFTETKWQDASRLSAAQLAEQLRAMLTRYGFTTTFDTGSMLENTKVIRRRIESGEVAGPRILTAGEPFVPRNGTPIYVKPLKLPELETPEQAVARVRERLKGGADAIKIFSGSLVGEKGETITMPLEIVRAVTTEAHRLGKPVLAHPQSAAGLKAAIDGGVDVLLHTAPEAGRLSRSQTDEMKRAGIALVPTLKLWRFVGVSEGMPPALVQRFQDAGVEQLRAYVEAGGQILFGTDVGFMTDYDPTEEYRQMARAGMSFEQILASLTTAPASRFGASKHAGRIARGMDADIVVLAGDPATDISALSNVRYTLRGGQFIYSLQPACDSGQYRLR